MFEPGYTLGFHLAPPLFAKRDPHTGLPVKQTFGPWLMRVFGWLAQGRRLRGTWLDPFGWTAERRCERRLIGEYERLVDELLAGLGRERLALAVEIAGLHGQVRGFGYVKARALADMRGRLDERLGVWRRPQAGARAA